MNKLEWDSDGSNFDNWADTSHGVSAQGMRCLRYTSTKFDDCPCSNTFNYICQYECSVTTTTAIAAATPPTTENPSEECNYPDGYALAASGAAKAYKKLTPTMEFTEAQYACDQDGATLYMPKTVQDLNDINEYGGKM